jgi:hypothetical protein
MNEPTEHYWWVFYGRAVHFAHDEVMCASGYDVMRLRWQAVVLLEEEASYRMLMALRWS